MKKTPTEPTWKYERGEGRHKHRWKNDYAGFEPGDKGPCRVKLLNG